MDAAPPVVQETVTSPLTEQIIERIAKQHGLHIDQAGLLEKLVNYTLIGYVGPEDFLRELRAGGIDDTEARQITGDVNKEIFVPLRARMEGKVAGEQEEESTVGSTSASIPRPVKPPVSRPMPPSMPTPASAAKPLPPRPIPAADELLLEDHEEPSPSFTEKSSAQASKYFELKNLITPKQPVDLDKTSVPSNLPGAVIRPGERFVPPAPPSPPVDRPVSPPPPAPPPAASPVPPRPTPPRAPEKPYAVDPYREPIDDTGR